MKSIGGYFELELNDFGGIYHDNAIDVNTGRNAFEYILRSNKKLTKVLLPYFVCDVLLQPIKKLNLEVEFYGLDNAFLPKVNSVKQNEVILYVNYFGIMNKNIKNISNRFENIIIDNSQAFYAYPIKNIPTFYSPRKFFGVADGGFLYTGKRINAKLEKDNSLNRLSQLFGRIEKGAEAFYPLFKENERKLDNLPLMKMSNLTKRLMKNINFEVVRQKRNENFSFLHNALRKLNELTPIIDKEKINGPMLYPFLKNGNEKLKKLLIKDRIYVATYWPNVFEWVNKTDWEYYLSENIIPLPIDQRYVPADLKFIIRLIKK